MPRKPRLNLHPGASGEIIDMPMRNPHRAKRVFQIILLLILSVTVVVRTCDLRRGELKTVQHRIEWDQAQQHVGEHKTVLGPVVSANYVDHVKGKPTFLDIGRPYPQEPRFNVVIWGEYRHNFSRPPEEMYRGKIIQVKGRVAEHRGVPQIIVQAPDAIEIIE